MAYLNQLSLDPGERWATPFLCVCCAACLACGVRVPHRQSMGIAGRVCVTVQLRLAQAMLRCVGQSWVCASAGGQCCVCWLSQPASVRRVLEATEG